MSPSITVPRSGRKDEKLEIRCSSQTLKRFKIYADEALVDYETLLNQSLDAWRILRRGTPLVSAGTFIPRFLEKAGNRT